MQIVASAFLKMYYTNAFFLLRSIVVAQNNLITVLNYGIKIGKGIIRLGKVILWGQRSAGATGGETSPY